MMSANGSKPLAGQAALVTGGGGGIGGASAAWLARDGAAVTIMGRTEATLVKARQEILEVAGSDATVDYFVGDALDAVALTGALAAGASPAQVEVVASLESVAAAAAACRGAVFVKGSRRYQLEQIFDGQAAVAH